MIEVLFAVLVLSFGLLGMAGMLATATQLPRLAANRATATNVAMNYIDRMRANTTGFSGGNYDDTGTGSYSQNYTVTALNDCAYPSCTALTLATMDKAYINRQLREWLPAGGMVMTRDLVGGTSNTSAPNSGNLWIIWLEPDTASALSRGSDNCPTTVTNTYTTPKPRCLYVRFSL